MRSIVLITTVLLSLLATAGIAAEFKRVTEPGYATTYVCTGQDIYTQAGRQVQRQVCSWQTRALDMPPGVYGSYFLGPLPQGPVGGPYCPPGFDCSLDFGRPRTRVEVRGTNPFQSTDRGFLPDYRGDRDAED
jgi:hypothetical protein